MPPAGGLSDKIGNRYEGRIAIWRLLQLLDDQHNAVRVRFEQPGDDHFEWWVQHADDSRTYTQVKRQQAPDKEWSIGTLVSRGVLTAFGARLQDDPSARCEFFSTLSASHLQDLTESAPLARDLEEFETQFSAARDKQASWQEICQAWPDISRQEAWQRLQRITVGTIDERSLRDTLRAHARALITPSDIVGTLGDFLDDHLAHELTAQDVWDFLRGNGFAPTDWVRDSNVHTKIHDTTRRYRDGIVTDRGPLAEIHRSATGKIANLLADPGGPAVVTIAADAGLGKTGLLGQLLNALDKQAAVTGTAAERPVVLAARLDRLSEFRDAASLGAALGLPASPAAVLSRVAAKRPALLVLDQVDAFGAGSGRNPARLEAVMEVLREARTLSVRVVIACRAFDLEVDDRLAILAGITETEQHAEGHYVERLGPLPPADVDKALHDAEINPGELTASLRELLRVPLHLRMLVRIQQRGELAPGGITTRLHLFASFYRTVCNEVETRQPSAPITAVTDRIADALSEHQELSVPAALLGEHPLTVEYLVSAGWLRRDVGRIAFAHEAFFDYAYAQRHIRSGLSLLDLLRSSEQHLFRRAQVRQILTLEREQDFDQYLRDIRDVLAAGDVRPHVKELVVTLVAWVSDPVIEEWQALCGLGDTTANPLAERAHALATQAPAFSKLMLVEGIVARYLSNPATADLGIWLCQLLVRTHPDEVAKLLLPYVGRQGWSGRLTRVVNVAPLQDSEPAVDLIEALIEAGDFDDAVRDPVVDSDFFALLYGLKGTRAVWGIRLVAAWLRRRLTTFIDAGVYSGARTPDTATGQQPSATPVGAESAPCSDNSEAAAEELLTAIHAAQSRRLLADSMSAPEILATLAADDPAAFAEHLLPVVRAAAAASRTGQVTDNGEYDQAFGTRLSMRPQHDPTYALLGRLVQAIQTAAGAGAPGMSTLVRQMAPSTLATEQALVAAGFACGHPDLLNDAVSWLETGPYALAQGWLEDLHGLSADVIAQIATRLPTGQTQKVQERAATYTNDFEKRHRHVSGSAAQRLLRDIPVDRLTDVARTRLNELNRKFPPGPATRAPRSASGADMSIQSPISLDAVQRMNHDQLFGAMRRWSTDDWQALPDGRIRGGATSVAQIIGTAAEADPNRFTTVLQSLPPDIPSIYIQYILSGLGRGGATPEQLLLAIKAAQAHLSTCTTEIAWLVGQAAPHLDTATLTAAGLSMTGLLTLLEEILNLRPDQQPENDGHIPNPTTALRAWFQRLPKRSRSQQPTAAADAGKKVAERLTSRMLNQPEYPALRALATLAHRSPQAATMLTSQLARLSASPYLPLRALAIETAAAQDDQDPQVTMNIVTTALQTNGLNPDTGNEPLPADARVLLASDQLRNLLLRLSWSHYELAGPLLAQMLRVRATGASGTPTGDLPAAATQAAENAAMITAVAACRHPEAIKRTRNLARKPITYRRGIATALAQTLPLPELTDELITILTKLFDDPDDEVARIASTGLHTIPAGNDDLARNLLSAASKTRTFTVAPARVVFAVEHYHGHIPETVLDIAERFFQLHAGDQVGRGFHDASVLGRLVINIYDQEPPTSPLASRALDLIDAMILARAYGLEERIAQLDR